MNEGSESVENGFGEFISRLNVSQDNRLKTLVEHHIEKNSRTNGIPGYRLEIFFKSGASAREEALNIKAEFLSVYPDVNVHVKFISPDFKVRVGDFRTKSDAFRFMKQIEGRFKAFIVPDVIEFPVLESANR